MNNKHIGHVKSFIHLVVCHIITTQRNDDDDICKRRCTFTKQVNNVICFYSEVAYYKILYNLSCIPSSQHFELHQASRSLRISTTVFVINKPRAYDNFVTSSFFYPCIDCWNSLPSAVTQSSSVSAFRNAASKTDLSNSLKGRKKLIHQAVYFQ
jgi:hypothetical protein